MRIASFVLAVVALAMSAGAAHAKSAIQITPDTIGTIILVNKPVGTEQWVLTLSLDDDTLIGNVFDTSGGNATFFSCLVDGDDTGDPTDLPTETLTFTCQIASGCAALPCDQDVEWHDLGSTPTLPGSFFLP